MMVECPACHASLGEIDVLTGLAVVDHIDEAGEIVWAGDTEIAWDAQKAKHDPPRFECLGCGRVFTFDTNSKQFIEVKED